MKITGNEPANSTEGYLDTQANDNFTQTGDNGFGTFHGITIRQQFAMAAIQGLLSTEVPLLDYKIFTNRAVNIADYLIKSLNEKPNPNQ